MNNNSVAYRCPGCGEMVDTQRLDDVLLHHQHVLHPRPARQWFQRVAVDSPAPADGRPETTNDPLRVLPNETYATSAAARLRRYGHA